jgi:hypothetical protein
MLFEEKVFQWMMRQYMRNGKLKKSIIHPLQKKKISMNKYSKKISMMKTQMRHRHPLYHVMKVKLSCLTFLVHVKMNK